MKNFIFTIILGIIFIPIIAYAKPIINPIYSPERFQPSDAFHAGCENNINIIFSLENKKINGLNAILTYDPDQIEIVKIAGENEKEYNLSHTINNGKITLSKLKTEHESIEQIKFTITIKSKKNTDATKISFDEGSYILDEKGEMISVSESETFRFEKAPECTPDIVAPNITVLFPAKEDSKNVALDTYFKFDIKDSGKGINKDSISIEIDGNNYSINDIEHERKDGVLTIYPDFWMPFDTGFEVKITVSDMQVYGGANTTTQTYHFKTSNELFLLNKIDPTKFRKLVNREKYYEGTENECEFLSYAYAQSIHQGQLNNKDTINSINQKLNCKKINNETIKNYSFDDSYPITFLCILGRSLFGLTILFSIFKYCSK